MTIQLVPNQDNNNKEINHYFLSQRKNLYKVKTV